MNPGAIPGDGEAGALMTFAMRIVGPGRAGRSFAAALVEAGAEVDLLARRAPVGPAGIDVDAVLLCTPDRVIEAVAAAIEPSDAAVLHCSGVTGLAALEPHARRGSVHPLMALPDASTGAARLRAGGWFGVSGDPIAAEIVELLGGRHVEVADEQRALYHATAAISANHLVALLGQVERLAAAAGVPAQAYFDLAAGSFSDVVQHGAAAALTGPAARGDVGTLAAHRAALPADERALYDALAEAATRLANDK